LDGKPAVLPKGKNVEISEDGQSLIAGIDGQVNYIDGKVSVFANYEVHRKHKFCRQCYHKRKCFVRF